MGDLAIAKGCTSNMANQNAPFNAPDASLRREPDVPKERVISLRVCNGATIKPARKELSWK
jgi:hypothetical protein